jgi:hypothetical protein
VQGNIDMYTDREIIIYLSDELQSPENRPCEYAWGMEIWIN